jgi:hypothetical protein
MFNSLLESVTMHQPTQRRTPITWFDARSVMLFAALTIGGAAVQAQTMQTQPQPVRTAQGGVSPTSTTTSTSTSTGSTARPADTLAEMKKQRRMNRGSAARKSGQ